MFPGRRRRTGDDRVAEMDEAAHHPRVARRTRGRTPMGQLDAVLGNPASRRNFLKGTGVLGASALLAACRKDIQASDQPAPAPTVPIDQEPGLLHVHEWAGYDAKWLYQDYLDEGYEQPK